MEINKEMLIAEFARQIDFANFTESNHTAPFRKEFLEYALALIKELTAENERLHASCTELTQCCMKLETLHKIECKRVDTIKAATVREMQERLTSFFANDENLEYIEVDAEYINEQIDQIAEEMIGEKK